MNKPDVANKFAKHKHNENIEGALGDVWAVQKPFSGCQVGKLVHQFNPLAGLGGSQIVPDQVHGVFPDKEQAMAVAQGLYEEHCAYEEALEEKKVKVTEKLKKTMTALEKRRTECMGMIKENPKESGQHKQSVAELTTKIDELMNKLEAIENSKKNLKKPEDKKKELNEIKQGDKVKIKDEESRHNNKIVKVLDVTEDGEAMVQFNTPKKETTHIKLDKLKKI